MTDMYAMYPPVSFFKNVSPFQLFGFCTNLSISLNGYKIQKVFTSIIFFMSNISSYHY